MKNLLLRKSVWILFLLAVAGIFHRSIAAFFHPVKTVVQQAPPPARNAWNYRQRDSVLQLLQDGDLVLRAGADATSFMLRQMNATDKSYSHCGIVMIEQGTPVVYHSIGGEDNPESTLRRDSAAFFLSPAFNERIGLVRLRLSKAQVRQLHEIVKEGYRKKIRFDLAFDLATDDKMYCSEFVYKSVTRAVADTSFFPRSRLRSKTYIGIDNLYQGPYAKRICDVRFK